MDDNNDPRFVSIKINSSGPITWKIRQIAKDTEAGRTFFYEHYRPFRLKMLEEAPHAFWTQLKREILLPREEWDRRLQRPTAYTFVALKKEEDTIISSLIVRGPLPTSDLTSPIWMQLGHAGCSEYWEINAVFTTENNRRKGVMSAMIDEAVRVVKKFVSEQQEDQKRKTFVRVLVLVGNEEATGLYEKAGFTEKWENSGEWELVRWIGFDDASPGAASQRSDGLSPV